MPFFLILVTVTLIITGAVMMWITHHARQVPGQSEESGRRTRLNPDVLRLLAYALMVAILLLAAFVELAIMR